MMWRQYIVLDVWEQYAKVDDTVTLHRSEHGTQHQHIVLKHCALQVDQTFDVRGVGSVLSGTVLSGEILLGQQLWLGPSETGTFSIVAVTGIQREQVLLPTWL